MTLDDRDFLILEALKRDARTTLSGSSSGEALVGTEVR